MDWVTAAKVGYLLRGVSYGMDTRFQWGIPARRSILRIGYPLLTGGYVLGQSSYGLATRLQSMILARRRSPWLVYMPEGVSRTILRPLGIPITGRLPIHRALRPAGVLALWIDIQSIWKSAHLLLPISGVYRIRKIPFLWIQSHYRRISLP